jgi:ABC-type phosphate/phosphonate transport system permease subunit
MKTTFNKYLYIGFILFGIYELLVKHSASEAAPFIGIALAFDPFNPEQPWKERPTWQKAVLIIHLAFVATLFGYMIGNPLSDFRKGFMEGWKKVN